MECQESDSQIASKSVDSNVKCGVEMKEETNETVNSSLTKVDNEPLHDNENMIVSADSEEDFFKEDLNINIIPNENINEDVEDIVQDLENLLDTSNDFKRSEILPGNLFQTFKEQTQTTNSQNIDNLEVSIPVETNISINLEQPLLNEPNVGSEPIIDCEDVKNENKNSEQNKKDIVLEQTLESKIYNVVSTVSDDCQTTANLDLVDGELKADEGTLSIKSECISEDSSSKISKSEEEKSNLEFNAVIENISESVEIVEVVEACNEGDQEKENESSHLSSISPNLSENNQNTETIQKDYNINDEINRKDNLKTDSDNNLNKKNQIEQKSNIEDIDTNLNILTTDNIKINDPTLLFNKEIDNSSFVNDSQNTDNFENETKSENFEENVANNLKNEKVPEEEIPSDSNQLFDTTSIISENVKHKDVTENLQDQLIETVTNLNESDVQKNDNETNKIELEQIPQIPSTSSDFKENPIIQSENNFVDDKFEEKNIDDQTTLNVVEERNETIIKTTVKIEKQNVSKVLSRKNTEEETDTENKTCINSSKDISSQEVEESKIPLNESESDIIKHELFKNVENKEQNFNENQILKIVPDEIYLQKEEETKISSDKFESDVIENKSIKNLENEEDNENETFKITSDKINLQNQEEEKISSSKFDSEIIEHEFDKNVIECEKNEDENNALEISSDEIDLQKEKERKVSSNVFESEIIDHQNVEKKKQIGNENDDTFKIVSEETDLKKDEEIKISSSSFESEVIEHELVESAEKNKQIDDENDTLKISSDETDLQKDERKISLSSFESKVIEHELVEIAEKNKQIDDENDTLKISSDKTDLQKEESKISSSSFESKVIEHELVEIAEKNKQIDDENDTLKISSDKTDLQKEESKISSSSFESKVIEHELVEIAEKNEKIDNEKETYEISSEQINLQKPDETKISLDESESVIISEKISSDIDVNLIENLTQNEIEEEKKSSEKFEQNIEHSDEKAQAAIQSEVAKSDEIDYRSLQNTEEEKNNDNTLTEKIDQNSSNQDSFPEQINEDIDEGITNIISSDITRNNQLSENINVDIENEICENVLDESNLNIVDKNISDDDNVFNINIPDSDLQKHEQNEIPISPEITNPIGSGLEFSDECQILINAAKEADIVVLENLCPQEENEMLIQSVDETVNEPEILELNEEFDPSYGLQIDNNAIQTEIASISERKSISYSREIKELYESEHATQSAVASILSGALVAPPRTKVVSNTSKLSNLECGTTKISLGDLPHLDTESSVGKKEGNFIEKDEKSVELPDVYTTKSEKSSVPSISKLSCHATEAEVLKQPLKVDTNPDVTSGNKSLKITITKNKFDNKHSILKIYDPKETQNVSTNELIHKTKQNENDSNLGENSIPKITLKPILSEDSDNLRYAITSKPEIEDSSNRHFTVETVQSQNSPKLRIKSVCSDSIFTAESSKRNRSNEREVLSPLKITLKCKNDEEQGVRLTKSSDDSCSSHSPKITIKPILKPTEEVADETVTRSQSPRIIIKPIPKPEDQDEYKGHRTCPKITIKPITKPESENIEDHLSKKEQSLNATQSVYKPQTISKNVQSSKDVDDVNLIQENVINTPRITIKPILKPEQISHQFYDPKSSTKSKKGENISVNDDFESFDKKSPKTTISRYPEDINREERRHSPRLVSKISLKDESTDFITSDDNEIKRNVKVTIKPVVKSHSEQYQINLDDYETSESCETSITPLFPNKPESPKLKSHIDEKIEESTNIPKITIKPILKQDNYGEEKSTPKIVIKPIPKPGTISGSSGRSSEHNSEDFGSSPSEIKRIKLTSLLRKDNEISCEKQKSGSNFANFKSEDFNMIDFEDEIKQERIVLKINKGTISSPGRSASDKMEKLSKLKMKLFKEGNKRSTSEPQNQENKKQKIEMGDITISLIDSDDSHDSTSMNLNNPEKREFGDAIQIIPLGTTEKPSERKERDVDPLEDIPVFEITPETANTIKQNIAFECPSVSSSSNLEINSPIPQIQMPRKRGRPRKVPLVVREEFKDLSKDEIISESITVTDNVSSRPKRSCRGQSVRSTLGIKTRKPRGRGGGRGRGRGRGRTPTYYIGSPVVEELKAPKSAREDVMMEDQKQEECGLFSSKLPVSTSDDLSVSGSLPSSLSAPPPKNILETPKSELYEEETRMSADNSRAPTPAKQTTTALSETVIEESQSSMQSTATTESEKTHKVRRIPKHEVHMEPEGEVISADKLAEYFWGGGGPFMLQEQVAQFLGIKSFKRKYPGIHRRTVDMQERDFIRESGLASEAMCDMGLTAVKSEDILDIMYADFQPKYEEYCKHQRDRHAKDISNKQRALNLAASQEKNKLDIVEQAIQSASTWNATFNKSRNEERKGFMDLQTFTIHFPTQKVAKIGKSNVSNYPVAVVPGQFSEYYKAYTPSEWSHLPLNTRTCKSSQDFAPEVEDSQSDISESESGSSSSDSESSDSSSGVEDCKMCRVSSTNKKLTSVQ